MLSCAEAICVNNANACDCILWVDPRPLAWWIQEAEESETEAMFKRERAGGNYGGGTKELQLINFKKRQEREAKRKGLFETGLSKFNKKDIQGVLL